MNHEDLESLLRKARKIDPPANLKQRILQQVAVDAVQRSDSPKDRSFSLSWSLIAACWLLVLTLWNSTPNPLPTRNPHTTPLPSSATQHLSTLELIRELGLALDFGNLSPAPQKLSSQL